MNINSLFFFLFLSIIFCSCDSGSNQTILKDSLILKDKQIDSLEKQLRIKEDSLKLLASLQDTSSKTNDTIGVYKPELIGRWNVTMQCIETSCEGPAVGDVKNEQWEVSYEGTILVAKVISANKVTRTYKGMFINKHIELKNIESTSNTQMTVTLQEGGQAGSFEGIREILRGVDCRIRHSVKLQKI